MQIITIANHKGGAAKTTTALTLADGLREKNYKVLLVDLDTQCNLSMNCKIDFSDLQGNSLYDVFSRRADINDCLFQIFEDTPDFDILSAGLSELDGIRKIDEQVLYKALGQLKKDYDYCIIDTPPSLKIATRMAIKAAEYLITPVQPNKFSLWGIANLFATAKELNPRIDMYMLITQISARTKLGEYYLEQYQAIAKEANITLFESMISTSVKVPESQHNETTLFRHSPRCKVSKEYRAFIDEFERNIENG